MTTAFRDQDGASPDDDRCRDGDGPLCECAPYDASRWLFVPASGDSLCEEEAARYVRERCTCSPVDAWYAVRYDNDRGGGRDGEDPIRVQCGLVGRDRWDAGDVRPVLDVLLRRRVLLVDRMLTEGGARCPLTGEPLIDPVVFNADGRTYSRTPLLTALDRVAAAAAASTANLGSGDTTVVRLNADGRTCTYWLALPPSHAALGRTPTLTPTTTTSTLPTPSADRLCLGDTAVITRHNLREVVLHPRAPAARHNPPGASFTPAHPARSERPFADVQSGMLRPFDAARIAAARPVPDFARWLETLPMVPSRAVCKVWDARWLYGRYAAARGLAPTPFGIRRVVEDLEVRGALLFAHHPTMDADDNAPGGGDGADRALFVFANVRFVDCTLEVEHWSDVRFEACRFERCTIDMTRQTCPLAVEQCEFDTGCTWLQAGSGSRWELRQ